MFACISCYSLYAGTVLCRRCLTGYDGLIMFTILKNYFAMLGLLSYCVLDNQKSEMYDVLHRLLKMNKCSSEQNKV